MQPYSARAHYGHFPTLDHQIFGDFHSMQNSTLTAQNPENYAHGSNYTMTMTEFVPQQQANYRELKKQQPLIFAQHYLSEFRSLPVKPEFDKYFRDNPEQWNNLKLRLENGDSSSDELSLLNPEDEEKPKLGNRKRSSQYHVKVEQLPIGRISKEFNSVQTHYDLRNSRNSGRTYHNFTIIPRKPAEVIDLTGPATAINVHGQNGPEFAVNQPSQTLPPLQLNNRVQNPMEVLQEIRSEAQAFSSRPRRLSDQNKLGTVEFKGISPMKAATAPKKREITRTFCNGARAIVSYFSLDEPGRAPKARRTAAANPFAEYNSRIGTVL